MKKVYTKPEIMFESFTLSASIAGDCGTKTNTPSQGNCAYGEDTDFGVAIFTDAVTACVYKESNDGSADGIFNGICYHVPTEGMNLFNS